MYPKAVFTFFAIGALSVNALTTPVARSPAPELEPQRLEAGILLFSRELQALDELFSREWAELAGYTRDHYRPKRGSGLPFPLPNPPPLPKLPLPPLPVVKPVPWPASPAPGPKPPPADSLKPVVRPNTEWVTTFEKLPAEHSGSIAQVLKPKRQLPD